MQNIPTILLISILMLSCNHSRQAANANEFATNPVVAHRGAFLKNNLPQNSIASLKEAIRLGCAGSEFDIHMTADDSLVINHDADHHGLVIEKTNYAKLAAIQLSNGETIPSLREYILAGIENNSSTQLVLEIKPSMISKERGIQIAEKVWNLVQTLQLEKKVSYISFDYDILLKLRSLDADASLQYLNGEKSPAELAKDEINGLDYHHSVYKKHPEWISEGRQLGLTLNVWTVNTREDLQFFLDKKFDFITTNEPELLFEMMK